MTSSMLAVALLVAQVAAEPVSIMPTQSNVGASAIAGTWQLKDGELIGHADPGKVSWFRVGGDYWDFELEAEFMTPKPANGGVQIRAQWLPQMSADGAGPKAMFGYQANIDTADTLRTGEILIQHGQPPLCAAIKDVAGIVKPADWNSLRVRAVGHAIAVFVNEKQVSAAYDENYIGGLIALQVQPNESGPAEVHYRNVKIRDLGRSGNWKSLFDGKSLTGWKIFGTEDFHVKDGVIECRRGPKESEGYLATEEQFTDFRVRGRFHMLGDGNYGLFYHSTITLREKDGYPVIAGLQGEVEPSFPGSSGWVYESYRRGWLVQPDKTVPASVLLRVGEWNEIEIRSVGNRITTWINGMRVLELTDPTQQLFTGSFALQLHTGQGAGIDWKDLYVTNP